MALQRASIWGFLVYLFCIGLLGCSNGSGSVEEGGDGGAVGGGGGSSSPPPPTGGGSSGNDTFAISVLVSGLVGDGLVLQNNGADNIAVAANGRLTFSQAIQDGAAYNVTILSQPAGPAQSCSVVGGAGTVARGDVTNISVTCSTPDAQNFVVGGTVSGLVGTGLVLQNNNADNLTINSNGQFSFGTALATGSAYDVRIVTNPTNPAQTCSVNSNTGTVGTADVTNVAVTCSASSFSVGFSVSGLRGSGLQVQLNGNEVLNVTADATYNFTQPVAKGAPYSVAVLTQPSSPKQTCVVNNPTGIVDNANITNVAVSCTTDRSIGGQVKGLAGRGLVLQLNGANNLSINSDGAFQFSTVLPRGAQYSVTVLTQPSSPTQECTIKNGSGAVGGSNVDTIAVDCKTRQFMLKVNVSGLQGNGLELRNEWGSGSKTQHEDLSVAGNGSVNFTKAIDSGATYSVSVHKRPSKPRQECTIDSPTGTVGGTDVTINVTCAAPTEFAVGGSLSGLQGQGLQLQNNGGDTLSLTPGTTSFEFPGFVAVGGSYNVSVAAQPASPTQDCAVSGGSGTIGSADINSVSVACTTRSFTVGGTVTGFSFPNFAVQMQINGGETVLATISQPTFTFPTALLSGTAYSVVVVSNLRCAVTSGGSGIVGGANVTDIVVTCS
ncbi:MAG: hypothetical protein ABW110_16195 [Steroidobacteraceae bacterium]